MVREQEAPCEQATRGDQTGESIAPTIRTLTLIFAPQIEAKLREAVGRREKPQRDLRKKALVAKKRAIAAASAAPGAVSVEARHQAIERLNQPSTIFDKLKAPPPIIPAPDEDKRLLPIYLPSLARDLIDLTGEQALERPDVTISRLPIPEEGCSEGDLDTWLSQLLDKTELLREDDADDEDQRAAELFPELSTEEDTPTVDPLTNNIRTRLGANFPQDVDDAPASFETVVDDGDPYGGNIGKERGLEALDSDVLGLPMGLVRQAFALYLVEPLEAERKEQARFEVWIHIWSWYARLILALWSNGDQWLCRHCNAGPFDKRWNMKRHE